MKIIDDIINIAFGLLKAMTSIFVLIFIGFVFFFAIFDNKNKEIAPSGQNQHLNEVALPEHVKYRVLEDISKRNVKRMVMVGLENGISKDDLKKLALKIKGGDPKTYERTFIKYVLGGRGAGAGLWATTHFDPDLDIRIYGLTMEAEAKLRKPITLTPDKTIMGTWLDEMAGVGSRVTLYASKDGALYIQRNYPEGWIDTEELIGSETEKGMRLDDREDNGFGEYYLINKAGQLEYWSKNGNYYTAKII